MSLNPRKLRKTPLWGCERPHMRLGVNTVLKEIIIRFQLSVSIYVYPFDSLTFQKHTKGIPVSGVQYHINAAGKNSSVKSDGQRCCRVWQSDRSLWPCGNIKRSFIFFKTGYHLPTCVFPYITSSRKWNNYHSPKQTTFIFKHELNYFCTCRIPQKAKANICESRFWQSKTAKKIKNHTRPDEKWRITIDE